MADSAFAFWLLKFYSRSLRFQLIKSPSVVEDEDEEEDCEDDEFEDEDGDDPEEGAL